MTLNGSIETLAPDIKRAAKFVSHQWPGVIEADDAEQDIHIRLLGSEGSIQKILEMEPRARYRAIVGIANQLASQERTDYAYFKGSYSYSVAEVKDLLKKGSLHDDELHLSAQDCTKQQVSSGESEPTTQIPVQVSDLREALIQLSERHEGYAAAIIRRYRLGKFPDTVKERDALHRGTESLTNEMNRIRRVDHTTRDDGPGTRQPIRREAARFQSKESWDADYSPAPSGLRDNGTEREVWE